MMLKLNVLALIHVKAQVLALQLPQHVKAKTLVKDKDGLKPLKLTVKQKAEKLFHKFASDLVF